jgi:hypothetical protein
VIYLLADPTPSEQTRPVVFPHKIDTRRMNTHVRNDHELLLESLLGGKLPRNLHWAEVIGLISQVGEVLPHDGGEFTFIVGNQRALFKRPSHDEFEVEETSRLRKFLKEGTIPGSGNELTHAERIIVVVDHHVAHIYQDVASALPNEMEVVKPYDPFGFHHHLIHRKEAHYSGDRIPEENSYYEEIAKDIAGAEEIIPIGHAKGKSSAMEYLIEFLKAHHPDLFKQVKATEVVDLSALTQADIEAIAKRHLRD